MFDVILSSRQRTMLFPANAGEEAVEAVLQTLRSSAGRARDILLGRDSSSPELADLAEDIAAAGKGVIERWHLLDRGSPYRTAVLDEAISLVTEVIEAAEGTGARAVSILALDADLAALVAARGRAILSDRLHTARGLKSIRSLAKDLKLSLGYLSDLETGRAGPPSAAVSEKLGRALDIDLSDVDQMRQRAEDLKRAHRERTARSRRRSAPGGTLAREDTRLRAIAVAAVEDPGLLDLIDVIRQLPRPARRGLERFLVAVLRASDAGEPERLRRPAAS